MTIHRFAALIGVGPVQVSNYELGKNSIDDKRAELIAEALRVPVVEVRRQFGLWVPKETLKISDLSEDELAEEVGRRFGIDPAALRGIVAVFLAANRARQDEQADRISQSDNEASAS